MKAVDNVAECVKISMLEVYELNVYEFLNFLSYISYKNKELEKQMNKM